VKLAFLAAVALAAVVIIAAIEVRSPLCSARSPHWFDILFFACGPPSVVAIFGAIVAYGHQRGWNLLGIAFAALGAAAVWTAVGLYVVVAILLPAGCLS
jgi:hypothetical protein